MGASSGGRRASRGAAGGCLAGGGRNSLLLFALGLSLCGFMLMGPDSLLSGVGAIDIGGRRGAIVAAGIINGTGSIGPIFQEEIIGWVLDNHGYRANLYHLVGMAILAVVGTGILALRCRRNQSSVEGSESGQHSGRKAEHESSSRPDSNSSSEVGNSHRLSGASIESKRGGDSKEGDSAKSDAYVLLGLSPGASRAEI